MKAGDTSYIWAIQAIKWGYHWQSAKIYDCRGRRQDFRDRLLARIDEQEVLADIAKTDEVSAVHPQYLIRLQ